PGVYRLQASIASVHARAKSPDQTDWPRISALYQDLMVLNPSPVVALNHAVAVAIGQGWEKGSALVEEAGSSGKLEGYSLFHAARADLLRRLHRMEEASQAYRRALQLTSNRVERDYLQRRLQETEKKH